MLSSLGSKENIAKQHIVFKGGKKYVPSPLSEHALVAGDMAISGGTPHSEKCNITNSRVLVHVSCIPRMLMSCYTGCRNCSMSSVENELKILKFKKIKTREIWP